MVLASLAAVALPLAGCGGDDGDASSEKRASSPAGSAPAAKRAAKEAVTVDIASFKYKPEAISVKAGGTVTFVNRDKAPHTAQTELNAKTAEFDTARLAKGDKKAVVLRDPGRFEYFCAYHRFMEGTVEVVK